METASIILCLTMSASMAILSLILIYCASKGRVTAIEMFFFNNKEYNRWRLLEKEIDSYEHILTLDDTSIYIHPAHPSERIYAFHNEEYVVIFNSQTLQVVLSYLWRNKSQQLYQRLHTKNSHHTI